MYFPLSMLIDRGICNQLFGVSLWHKMCSRPQGKKDRIVPNPPTTKTQNNYGSSSSGLM